MTKESFIRDTAQKLFLQKGKDVHLCCYEAKDLAEHLYPSDPQGLHETICKILLHTDFRKFQSSIVSIEEQYDELRNSLMKDISEQDMKRYSHCKK